MKNLKLYLYGTVGCHLCEVAEELLCEITNCGNTLLLEQIDIIEDEVLLTLYGIRIPVLKVDSSTQSYELEWPFNKKDIIDFLNQVETDTLSKNLDNKKAS